MGLPVDSSQGPHVGMVALVEKLDEVDVHESEAHQDEYSRKHSASSSEQHRGSDRAVAP